MVIREEGEVDIQGIKLFSWVVGRRDNKRRSFRLSKEKGTLILLLGHLLGRQCEPRKEQILLC